MARIDWPTTIQMWANLAQVAAVFGALIYFGYRLVIGYLVVNVSISIELLRASSASGRDHLAVTVHLKKGEHGAMVLHDVAGRVTWSDGATDIAFAGFDRLTYEQHENRARIRIDKPSSSKPLLTLPPGEETMIAAHVEVPSSAVCTVQVVVLGKIMGGTRYGQWRASAACLPWVPTVT